MVQSESLALFLLSEGNANKIFGCPLEDLLKRDGTEIPWIVTKIVHYIESQGEKCVLILDMIS